MEGRDNNNRNRKDNNQPKKKAEYIALTDENYVDIAEKTITTLRKQKEKENKKLVSTTKIRGILSMLADIYNEVQVEKAEALSSDAKARVNYLKIRFLYEAGREKVVKDFIEEAQIIKHLENIKGTREGFMLFYHYMEALIAYFKYYGLDVSDR